VANPRKTLLFNRSSFESKLEMKDYIAAVEYAHKLHGEKRVIETNLIHADAPNGEYHIKTGGLLGEQSYYGLKANGGFFNNKRQHGLPNILGVIYLSDAENAYPLAVFESSLISKMRTAAATAVAAKFLKPTGEIHLGIIGYGNQAEAQLEALGCVCEIASVHVGGRDQEKAREFATRRTVEYGIPVHAASIEETCRAANVLVTCTPSTASFVQKDWIQKGAFIAAVGADSPGKNELEPSLVASAHVVADIKSQIIKVGESQHAIREGLMSADDIYCELGQLITGEIPGRANDEQLFIYDSTGTAIQDVAAAAYVYEMLKDDASIQSINLFE
jgi:alanine dehydrogenase